MKYYRVKKEVDNYVIYTKKGHYLEYFRLLVGDELLTIKEYEKIKIKADLIKCGYTRKSFMECFDSVDINKNNTYFCFGARFAD